MAMRAFGWASILVVVFFTGLRLETTARAEDDGGTKRWVLSEATAGGAQTLIVIDEDTSRRDDPSVLSQKVVFKQRYSAAERADFESAKARYREEPPTSAKELRLPRRGRPLWIAVKDEWTAADEDDYSAWFAANVHTNFLRGTGLNADCADVGLTFRWVYAREHHLPIANTMSGSGKLFGNFTGSDAWDKLPTNSDWRRDERFKAALRDLYDETYTWSINDDQFPTVISRQYVRPGSVYMIIRSTSGHTQTIHSISDARGVETFWGNEPAAESIAASGLIVEFNSRKGFQNWRHVRRSTVDGREKWTLVPGPQMPGYSREQLETGHTNGTAWMNWVLARLGYQFSDEKRFAIFAKTFENSIDFRRNITGVGALYCGPGAPCPTTGADYDNYSTFSRDARLVDLRNEMRALAAKLGPSNSAVQTAKRALEARGEVALGTGTGFYDAYATDGIIESWNSDPNVSYLARWGYVSAPSSKLRAQSSADAFLEGLKGRESLVQSAYYQCHYWTCTGSEPSVRAVETSRLDAKMKGAYAELARLTADPGVDASTLADLRTRYRNFGLKNFTSSRCAGSGGACTADDVVWASGAAARVPAWSSEPKDDLTARWGL